MQSDNQSDQPDGLAGNLFAGSRGATTSEVIDELISGGSFRLERIVSNGQATPVGEWYDQETDEWVVLLSGAAGLRFEGEEAMREMGPGDFVHIAAHRRHRVEWTAADLPTVWLALHYCGGDD